MRAAGRLITLQGGGGLRAQEEEGEANMRIRDITYPEP